ncbi:MAG: PD-(D/E)XK nuclease family protein [Caulobacteraceae bacterium]|nr:PD-(D/E)XK nuclease family protein [Caulobacteraceae bacterium]
MNQLPPWSYSGIKTFEQCPKKYYHLKVARDYKEDDNAEHLLYGKQFHKAAEMYIKEGEPLPPQFSFVKKTLDNLKSFQGEKLCEYEMGLTADLRPCTFKAEEVWWRGIADLIILDREKGEARVVDYKTGKSAKYADTGQLELMALAVFKHFPEITKVKAALLFVVCNQFIKDSYDKASEEAMWDKWLRDYNRMKFAYSSDVWNPRPSGLCRKHCIVTECPHNGGFR